MIECSSTIFSFNSLSSNKIFLACRTSTDSNIQWKDLANDHASSLSLKSSSNLESLQNQFDNATPEKGNDPENISSSKYYDMEEMQNIKIPRYPNSKWAQLVPLPFSQGRSTRYSERLHDFFCHYC